MSDAVTAPKPPAGVPDVDEATVSLLKMLYGTSVYAVETFAYQLETYEGLSPDQRRKYEACRRLEVAMSRLLFDHLTRDLGIAVKPPSRARQAAQALAPHRHGTWAERMKEQESASVLGVTVFRTLKSMYGAREPHLCSTLIASEIALRDFARDEMDGETENSLHPVLAMLSDEDRAAVAAFA